MRMPLTLVIIHRKEAQAELVEMSNSVFFLLLFKSVTSLNGGLNYRTETESSRLGIASRLGHVYLSCSSWETCPGRGCLSSAAPLPSLPPSCRAWDSPAGSGRVGSDRGGSPVHLCIRAGPQPRATSQGPGLTGPLAPPPAPWVLSSVHRDMWSQVQRTKESDA